MNKITYFFIFALEKCIAWFPNSLDSIVNIVYFWKPIPVIGGKKIKRGHFCIVFLLST